MALLEASNNDSTSKQTKIESLRSKISSTYNANQRKIMKESHRYVPKTNQSLIDTPTSGILPSIGKASSEQVSFYSINNDQENNFHSKPVPLTSKLPLSKYGFTINASQDNSFGKAEEFSTIRTHKRAKTKTEGELLSKREIGGYQSKRDSVGEFCDVSLSNRASHIGTSRAFKKQRKSESPSAQGAYWDIYTKHLEKPKEIALKINIKRSSMTSIKKPNNRRMNMSAVEYEPRSDLNGYPICSYREMSPFIENYRPVTETVQAGCNRNTENTNVETEQTKRSKSKKKSRKNKSRIKGRPQFDLADNPYLPHIKQPVSSTQRKVSKV